jgi:uncharacterized membrane protein YecN with MAPEG domain
MNTTLLCSALLVLLYGCLSLNVSVTRLRKRKSSQITEAHLSKAIRAHGNASEYIPIFVALFVFLSITHPTPLLTVVAIVATSSRVLHAAGMFRAATVTTRHPLKVCGALGTYICLFSLAIMLLLRALP